MSYLESIGLNRLVGKCTSTQALEQAPAQACRTAHLSAKVSRRSTPLRSCARLPPRLQQKCRTGLVVRASESAVSAARLQYTDLVDYLKAGCKPRESWRIGTEHEKFGFKLDDLSPMGYDEVKALLEGLQERFGWEPIMEQGNIIGVKQDGQSVTLEPGGQFELSGDVLETLHQTCAEVNSHLYQVKSIAEEIGVGFLGLGFQPKWTVDETPVMPKGRYKIMKAYMPKVGSMGLDMMFRTATIQVNLDFESEEDMVEKFRISLALQPIATALFANSPFTNGKPNGFKSKRSQVWTDVDVARTGDLPFVFEEGFGFSRYADWVLDVPMYFVYRDGQYIDVIGQSFRDFMEGNLQGPLNGEYPTLDDWEAHLTTVFPEVRLKKFLEMRGADGGPFRRICALPALWVGLLYDAQAQQEAYALVSSWTEQERAALRNEVPKLGLQTPFRDGTVQDVAQDVLKIAKGGLQRRGFKETRFLQELEKIVETGRTPADVLLENYNGKWEGSVDKAFKDYMF